MQAYCVKCRAKKEMKDAKSITMKNGKPATQGVCPTCGTKMFRIGKSQGRYRRYQNQWRGWVSTNRYPAFLLSTAQTGRMCNRKATQCNKRETLDSLGADLSPEYTKPQFQSFSSVSCSSESEARRPIVQFLDRQHKRFEGFLPFHLSL